MYKLILKRIFDFVIALALLVLLSPLLILTTILLTIANSGKPFFFQIRPGKHCKLFRIIKFKTMNDKRGIDGELLSDSDRITAFGSFVRKASLDELPQLINVLKGDMSLIGPRPLLPEYVALYSNEQARRHDLRPGITGWAQVNGRNTITWAEKFRYDVWYIENVNFFLDLKITLMTIKKILNKEGISSGTSATMEKFTGN